MFPFLPEADRQERADADDSGSRGDAQKMHGDRPVLARGGIAGIAGQ